jgi:hypothetical protein
MRRMFIKKYFLFTVGSVCCVKCSQLGRETCQSPLVDDEEVETEVRKWLRQQSKDSYDAGFDAFVKRWDKDMSRNVFSRFEYHMFYVLYPFVNYLLTLPRRNRHL